MFKWRLNDIRYLLSLTLPSFGYILNRGHCISYCESRVHSEKIGDYTIVALNKELFDGKRRKFIKEGPRKLKVVSDFDFTLTRFWVRKVRGYSTHAVVESAMASNFVEEAHRLLEFYYPFEISTTISLDEKIMHMMDWTVKVHDILVASKISRIQYIDAVHHSLLKGHVKLRAGVWTFLNNLAESGIPCLIFSAGVGNIVEEILVQEKLYEMYGTYEFGQILYENIDSRIRTLLPPTVHTVSNRMKFTGPTLEGVIIGFDDLIFHVYNKQATSILDSPFLKENGWEERHNVLLLGDSLGDLNMTNGLGIEPDSIIRIGFLNDHLERFPDFLNSFDVVVLGDPGLDFPLELVRDIINGENNIVGLS